MPSRDDRITKATATQYNLGLSKVVEMFEVDTTTGSRKHLHTLKFIQDQDGGVGNDISNISKRTESIVDSLDNDDRPRKKSCRREQSDHRAAEDTGEKNNVAKKPDVAEKASEKQNLKVPGPKMVVKGGILQKAIHEG